MKIKIGDYFIETDERQYKVKKYIGKDKDDKDLYKTLAYCTTLSGALKFIPEQVIRENEDINIIKDKLTQIEQEIKEHSKFEEEVKKVYEKRLEVAIKGFKAKQKTEGESKDE
jgi:hypothetical protein